MPHAVWQNNWVEWDRKLLGPFGLRALIESAGPAIPLLLETAYLLLYTFPILALCTLYVVGDRPKINRFLMILLAGTLTVYGLLPHFAVHSPRLIFTGTDLPAFSSLPRLINTWILDHFDISTSVFPSGHVGVAFSNAFGLYAVLPERRSIWIPAFVLGGLVYIATIYGRYHYAFDGLASIAITVCMWRIVELLWPRET